MAKRQSKIRWRDSDHAELQRVINNFNAKLYRIKKAHPEMEEYLPQRVRKSDVVKSINTRADFNRSVNSLQRFSRKGAEEPKKSSRGAKSTKWEVKEFKIKERTMNAQRARERKRIESQDVKVAGKSQGVKRAEMGSVKENELKPSNKNFKSMSQKEWDKARSNIDSQLNYTDRLEKKEKMRENYIKGLRDKGILDANPDIEQLVRNVDLDTFFDLTQLDETATFEFYKDPIGFREKVDTIYETWSSAQDYDGGLDLLNSTNRGFKKGV